jgi:hypothetical protein
MNVFSRWARLLLVLTFAVGLYGCGGPKNGIVKGQVMLDGKPLSDVTIIFTHPETHLGVMVHTDANGHYDVKSYKDRGLPPGTYQVSVRPKREVESTDELVAAQVRATQAGGDFEPPKERTDILDKYQDAGTSGFVANVVAGDNPPFDFKLDSKP